MKKNHIILILATLFLAFTPLSMAQTSDFGAIVSVGLNKKINYKLTAKFEQELRFDNNLRSFDRTLTSVGLDYALIRKVLKAQVDYDFINKNQQDYYQIRQRASLALCYTKAVNSLEFDFKTRAQGMWRDERRGDYKINPRLFWRNKVECTYNIFGSPLKPFASAEVFCPLNSRNGFYMDGCRLVAGAKYRFTSRISTQLYFRYDAVIQEAYPIQLFYTGVAWTYKL